jgi:hypothetical protein
MVAEGVMETVVVSEDQALGFTINGKRQPRESSFLPFLSVFGGLREQQPNEDDESNADGRDR